MRTVKQETAFKKDLKREMSGRYRGVIEEELPEIVEKLAKDIPLPSKYKDHALSGKWIHHRDCHLRADLVLIYLKTDDNKLFLVRLGSHSEVF